MTSVLGRKKNNAIGTHKLPKTSQPKLELTVSPKISRAAVGVMDPVVLRGVSRRHNQAFDRESFRGFNVVLLNAASVKGEHEALPPVDIGAEDWKDDQFLDGMVIHSDTDVAEI
jgi:hypothetical protein